MKKITFKELRERMGYYDVLKMAIKFDISPSTIYFLDAQKRDPSVRLIRKIYQNKHAKAHGPLIKEWVQSLLEEK